MAAVGERTESRPGVLDLYRVGWAAAREGIGRWHLAMVVEVAFILVYILLRTGGAERSLIVVWLVAACGLSIVGPVSGLVVLAAIAPFSEPFVIDRVLGARSLLVGCLGLGVAIRIAIELVARRRSLRAILRPSAALVALGAVFVVLLGTAIGIAVSQDRFGAEFGDMARVRWVSGIGAGLVILLAAAWAGRRGDVRPLVVAVAAALLGAVVSQVDFADATAVRESAVAWMVRSPRYDVRLAGLIPSPNGVAALLIVPTGVALAAAVLLRQRAWQAGAALATAVFGVALYLTYSRAALIGLFCIAVVVTWRVRRALGAGLLLVGLVAGIALLPSYLQLRNQAVGDIGEVKPGEILVASDALRLKAWEAAGLMFLDQPLTGHGYMSYFRLHETYGDRVLTAPHNEWLRLFAEDGIVVGLAGLALLGATAVVLGRRTDPVSTGVLGGFLAFAVAATFNNPLLFIQVNAIALTIVGIGLGRAATAPPPEAAETAETAEAAA